MASDMREFCDKLFGEERVEGPRMSVEEFIAVSQRMHIVPHDGLRAAALRSNIVGSRNDVRSSGFVGLTGGYKKSSSPPEIDIFADRRYHADAAATLGSYAQKASGFGVDMAKGSAVASLQAYLAEMNKAPHWNQEKYERNVVHHENSTHHLFVKHLVTIVTEQLQRIGAGPEAIKEASDSIHLLSSTVSQGGTGTHVEKTLYASIGIARDPAESGPVFYGFFFTTLDMTHKKDGKSSVITTDADTYSVVFKLNSSLVQANAEAYNRLTTKSIDDWIADQTT